MRFFMLTTRINHRLARSRALALVLLVGLLLAPGAPADASRYASIVVDADSGQVLHARHANTKRYPASLTKLMTLYLTFEALENGRLKLGQELTASKRAAGMPPSRLGLKQGDKIKVRDIVLALVVKSANDAAVVIAEELGGTEINFGKIMTAKAKALGMKRTSFRNASGLHNRYQKSTAHDMARLATALLRDFPEYYHYFSSKSFAHGQRTYRNHNSLLRYYEGADGMKTGYVRASGFNLVASAERGDRRVIGVVFGGKSARSRDAHMRTLLDRGFKQMTRAVVKIPGPPRRNPLRLAAKQAPTPQRTAALGTSLQVSAAPTGATPGIASPPPQPAGDSAPKEGAWGVQVGAFSRFAPAQLAATQAARRLPAILLDTHSVIQTVEGALGSPLYRARLIGLSESTAREACRKLKEMRHSCIVVPPQSAALH